MKNPALEVVWIQAAMDGALQLFIGVKHQSSSLQLIEGSTAIDSGIAGATEGEPQWGRQAQKRDNGYCIYMPKCHMTPDALLLRVWVHDTEEQRKATLQVETGTNFRGA